MRLGIGIDTGGTFTDAVIYDFKSRQVMGWAKALTTKEDLAIGIAAALDGLDPLLTCQADFVSLSTTLATNACVEKKGGRAKLIFIGIEQEIVDKVGEASGLKDKGAIYCVDAETSVQGQVNKFPDWDKFLADCHGWLADADAIGIVELFSMYSGAELERKARELLEDSYRIPIICGHELFSDLNAIKRGAGALLNAQLIPVLREFLAAVQKNLLERHINAPVSIVRSDGSLMSEQFAQARPVETILSGPAASIIGADFIAPDHHNAIIVDMGGTTTDFALIRAGVPVKAKNGINIGDWQTFVKGLFVETIGLGGDSAIRYEHKKLFIDTKRVMPISGLAERYPAVTNKLEQLALKKGRQPQDAYEFLLLIKDIKDNDKYSPIEQEFCEALRPEPLTVAEAKTGLGHNIYYFNMERLEREGVIIRCGLTPTDIMHLKGDMCRYPLPAAQAAAKLVANCAGLTVEQLCEQAYLLVKQKLYYTIVKILCQENYPELFAKGLSKDMEAFITQSYATRQQPFSALFKTDSVLIGVGAPIHIFLPDVACALHTEYLIPEFAGVMNALGTVVGNVSATATVQIQPYKNIFIVHYRAGKQEFTELEPATEFAKETAQQEAVAEAEQRGACGNIIAQVEHQPVYAKNDDGPEIFIEATIIATATGKFKL